MHHNLFDEQFHHNNSAIKVVAEKPGSKMIETKKSENPVVGVTYLERHSFCANESE